MTEGRRLKVLTAIGSDRPGLVRAISAAAKSAGANIEDSRMAVLGGEFAIIMLCSGRPAELERLQSAGARFGKQLGLDVSFKDTVTPGVRDFSAYRMRVSGLDHPGIVECVTEILAERRVNVASMDTRLVHMPLTGTPTFVLDAELEVPGGASPSELRRALNEACERESLELLLEPSAVEP
jgi:glycine cleavage system transcriptional repressor